MTAPISRGVGFWPVVAASWATAAPDDGAELVFAGGLRHVGLDHDDLGLLLCGELGTVALGEALDRLVALLEERGEDLGLFGVGERLALVDLFGAQGGLDHAQGGEAMLLVGLHGGDDVGAEFLCDAHCKSPCRGDSARCCV